jgi:alkylation response protein AidB-like acyl-CoA dehydrogenase
MDTQYTPEQQAFRTTLRRFLETSAGTAFTRQQWHERIPATPAHWQSLGELGVTGLLVPEQSGGMSGAMTDVGVVMEELGRVVYPGPCWSSCVGATSAAAVFGLDSLLRSLAGGSRTATLALEEPGRTFTGWQQAQLSVRNDTLHGAKTQVPDAFGAHQLFVTTANGVYLVAADAPGLTITATECLDGTRRFADIHFDGVAGQRLGDNARLAPVVDRMLVALCADGLGAAGRALELAVAYASERRQFGQHIGAFQAIQHLCADMLQQLELARAGLHYALWAQDAEEPDEAHRAAVMCKAFVAETFPQIGANAIQIFGGAGFTWEYDIQLYYKRLLSTQMTWGGSEVWLEELATLVIDRDAPPITIEK